jgi:hypothetical protein
VQFSCEQTDIQTLSSIAGSICAICFSIPIFLKEVDFRLNFWQQFFIAGLIAFIATILGILIFLQFGENDQLKVAVHFITLVIIIFPVSISYIANRTSKKRFSPFPKSNNRKIINFAPSITVTALSILVSAILSSGNKLIIGFIVAGMFSFFHILIILLSILIEILYTQKLNPENDLDLKRAIQRTVESNAHIVTTEQLLIDSLRHGVFAQTPEHISRTHIEQLVVQMDRETKEGMPAITILNSGGLIPRWKTDFNKVLAEEKPFLIILYGVHYTLHNFWGEIDRNLQAELFHQLSLNTKLSEELLKDNNSLLHKYQGVQQYKRIGNSTVLLYDKKIEHLLPENQKIELFTDLRKYHEELKSIVIYKYDNDLEDLILNHVNFDKFFGKEPGESSLKELIKKVPNKKIEFYISNQFYICIGEYCNEYELFHKRLNEIYSDKIRNLIHLLEIKGDVKSEMDAQYNQIYFIPSI